MRYLTRYDLSPHMLDGLGRRVCRSCKAVWPCERHPLTVGEPVAAPLPVYSTHVAAIQPDHVCGECGYHVCACEADDPLPVEPPQPQTDERLPPGWHVTDWSDLRRCEAYRNDVARVWVQRHNGNDFWLVNAVRTHNARVAADHTHYPSMLRAMAAALGYTIEVADGEDGGWAWTSPSMSAEGCADTADEAAWAACDHHARTNGYA